MRAGEAPLARPSAQSRPNTPSSRWPRAPPVRCRSCRYPTRTRARIHEGTGPCSAALARICRCKRAQPTRPPARRCCTRRKSRSQSLVRA
eukprot:1852759-Prymnesium_polylepis.1